MDWNSTKGFYTETVVKVSAEDVQGMRAGLTAFYNDSYHYEIYLTREQEKYKVCLAKHIHDILWLQQVRKFQEEKILRLGLKQIKLIIHFHIVWMEKISRC